MHKMKSLRQYATPEAAYDSTTEEGRIAVRVITYYGEDIKLIEYYSYISEYDTPEDLREDFPLCLGSNQAIEELNQFD